MTKACLLWVDLEMTGLSPATDRIIEVGVIATDWDFRDIARFESTVKVDQQLMETRMVGEFWEKNSASRDAMKQKNLDASDDAAAVETKLIDFIDHNFDADQPVYLAGNSIWNDRKFIEREWPNLDKKLHYRMLDVSAWKIVFENKYRKRFTKPEAHRAMSDIEGSIEELKFYLKKVKA